MYIFIHTHTVKLVYFVLSWVLLHFVLLLFGVGRPMQALFILFVYQVCFSCLCFCFDMCFVCVCGFVVCCCFTTQTERVHECTCMRREAIHWQIQVRNLWSKRTDRQTERQANTRSGAQLTNQHSLNKLVYSHDFTNYQSWWMNETFKSVEQCST